MLSLFPLRGCQFCMLAFAWVAEGLLICFTRLLTLNDQAMTLCTPLVVQFPDLVHSLRPNPKNHIQEGWRILDFLSHHPESCHILTWLLDDNGIPANWRQMEGYGVNTFKLINREGVEHLCKFHVMPKGGACSGCQDLSHQCMFLL